MAAFVLSPIFYFIMYTSDQLLNQFNDHLSTVSFDRQPKGLYDPINYVLSLGGKRIRPVLMMLAHHLYKDELSAVYNTAVGIEIYHNYTLLHDDLMDRSDKRRGQPTVHKVWDDNTAILSGDAMLVLAYQFITECPSMYLSKVAEVFNATALEICEGQQFDVDFEHRDDVTDIEYLEMIRLKTAVLLAAALKIGAILGGASPKDADLLYRFGIQIGLAFQLQDDLLDVYGVTEVFGKNIGGDILCNKKTFMLIKALELAKGELRTDLIHWLNTDNSPDEKIAGVTAIYDRLGIRTICEKKMDEYYNHAMALLEKVDVCDSRKEELKKMVHALMFRNV